MSKAEYLTVFTAFIFGFIATEYLSGWGKILKGKFTLRKSWLFIYYSNITFLYLLVYWYTSFEKSSKIEENIYYFLFSLLPPALFYLISLYIFPRKIDNLKLSLNEYFYKNVRTVSLLFVLLHFVFLISYLVFETNISPNQYYFVSFTIGLFLLAYLINKRTVYLIKSIILLILLTFWIYSIRI